MLLALVVLRVHCCSGFRFTCSHSIVLLQSQADCVLFHYVVGFDCCGCGRNRIVRRYCSPGVSHLLSNISRMSLNLRNILHFNHEGLVPRYSEDAEILNRSGVCQWTDPDCWCYQFLLHETSGIEGCLCLPWSDQVTRPRPLQRNSWNFGSQRTYYSVFSPSLQLDSHGWNPSCICSTWIWKSGTLFNLELSSLEHGGHRIEKDPPRARLGPHLLLASHGLWRWFLRRAGYRVLADGVVTTGTVTLFGLLSASVYGTSLLYRNVPCTHGLPWFRFQCVIFPRDVNTCRSWRLSATPLPMLLLQNLLVHCFCTIDRMHPKQPSSILVLNILETLFVMMIAHLAFKHQTFFAMSCLSNSSTRARSRAQWCAGRRWTNFGSLDFVFVQDCCRRCSSNSVCRWGDAPPTASSLDCCTDWFRACNEPWTHGS